MNVQQQILIGRADERGTVRIRTAAATAGLSTGEQQDHERLCHGWSGFVPGHFGRALVHVPVPATDGMGIEAHVVAQVRSVDLDDGPGVSIHLVRLGRAGFATLGDDPYRLVRTGHLIEHWTPDVPWPSIDVDAIGEDPERGLRAVIPEQYPVLEALLRHALSDGPLVLAGERDDAAIEDLFEHLLHLVPRTTRQRTSFASFVADPDAPFDVSARPRDGSTFRASLRALLTDTPPALDEEREAYVRGLFEDLCAGAWGRAAARIESFEVEPVEPVPSEPAVSAPTEPDVPVASEPSAPVPPEPADDGDPLATSDADPVPAEGVFEPTIRFDESGPVTPATPEGDDPASATAEVEEFVPDAYEVEDPGGVDESEDRVADADEVEAPAPTTTEVEGWGEVELECDTPGSESRSARRLVLTLLVVAAVGAGGFLLLRGVPFGTEDSSQMAVDVDPLAVGVRASVATYVDDQFARIEEHRATDPPRFEFRQTLSRRRAGFERQLEATREAQARAVDDAIAAVLSSDDASDSTVARILRAEAETTRDVLPRLWRLHAGLAAGRPELLRPTGSGSDLPSSAADDIAGWADALAAWASWFEQPETTPVPTGAPTDGLAALAASLPTTGEAVSTDGVVEIWGGLPVALRGEPADAVETASASDAGRRDAR